VYFITHADSGHVGRVFSGVCASVGLLVCFPHNIFPHNISKTDAASIIKLDKHGSPWVLETRLFLENVKGQGHEAWKTLPAWSWRSCECWLLIAAALHFIYCAVDFVHDSVFYLLVVTQDVSKYWPEGMDKSKSYRCNTTEILYSNDNATASLMTKLTMWDVLLEAFQNTTHAEFSNAGL